jgi:lysozyme family protein
MDNSQIIDVILQLEGGFVNNAADHGGPTNYGITSATLGRSRNLGRPATIDEVRALSRTEAAAIYMKSFLIEPRFDQVVDSGTRLALVDTGVLHGQGRAIAYLRQCLGLPALPTGTVQLDDATLKALSQDADPEQVGARLMSLRLKSYTANVGADRTQMQFLAGWVNRVSTILQQI